MKKLISILDLTVYTILLSQTTFAQKPTSQNLLAKEKGWSFEENKGQLADEQGKLLPEIKYYGKDHGIIVYCQPGKISFVFTKVEKKAEISEATGLALRQAEGDKGDVVMLSLSKHETISAARMDLVLLNANPQAYYLGEEQQTFYKNYYLAHTPEEGITNVHTFNKVVYHNVYANLDMVLHTQEGGMKYEFLVHPGGKVSDIQLQWNGTKNLTALSDGGIKYENPLGELTESTPVCFTDKNTSVASSFNLADNIVSFKVGRYDKSETLVIDPSLVWGTYYGGSADDYGEDLKVDDSGNIYITGFSASTSGIASSSAYQTAYTGGKWDIYIAKFNSIGKRIWATYYGGSGDDYSWSISRDNSSNLYITGYTTSTSGIASSGAYKTSGGVGYDAYLAKFSNSGSRIWATYYGGKDNDYSAKVCVDDSDNVYFVGWTSSTSQITSTGAYQASFGGGTHDAFLVKFTNAGKRQWATYFGGSDFDECIGVWVDHSYNLYITGFTLSDSGIATSGVYQNSYGGGGNNGGGDAFLAKFNFKGNRIWATYFGGSGDDLGYSVTTDISNNIYIAGRTESTSTIASQGAYQTNYGGNQFDAFLAKFDTSGSRLWATYYGGSKTDDAGSVICDNWGNVYFSGMTLSTSGISTSGAVQLNFGGASDAFVAKFNTVGNRQWATYFGGQDYEFGGNMITADKYGNVSLIGLTKSTNAIATWGTQQTSNAGKYDAFIAKFKVTYINDTGIDSFFSLNGSICSSTKPVKVHLINYGTDTLKAVTINYSVNGTLQTAFKWTGSLNTDSSASVIIGNYNFTAGIDTLIAWTDSPNAQVDSNSVNDSVKVIITVNPLPKANAGKAQSICKGGSVAIGATAVSGNSYVWVSKPSGFKDTTANPTVSPTVTTTYYLTEKDTATRCFNTDSVEITVHYANGSTATVSACNRYVFEGRTLVTSGTYYDTLLNVLGCDSIITLNLTINKSSGSKSTVSACNSYFFNGNNLTISGTYYDTLTNINGCDSIVTLNLTIDTLSNKVTLSGKTLTAVDSLATYQWLDCNNSNKPISGATNRSYTTKTSGDYAVALTRGACKDTSTCMNVVVTGTEEIRTVKPSTKLISDYELRIFPNPTKGIVNLTFQSPSTETIQINIQDMLGKLVYSNHFNKTGKNLETTVDLSETPSGVYLIQCVSREGIVVRRIMVQ